MGGGGGLGGIPPLWGTVGRRQRAPHQVHAKVGRKDDATGLRAVALSTLIAGVMGVSRTGASGTATAHSTRCSASGNAREGMRASGAGSTPRHVTAMWVQALWWGMSMRPVCSL